MEILVGRINEIRVTGRLACAKPSWRRLIFTPMERRASSSGLKLKLVLSIEPINRPELSMFLDNNARG